MSIVPSGASASRRAWTDPITMSYPDVTAGFQEGDSGFRERIFNLGARNSQLVEVEHLPLGAIKHTYLVISSQPDLTQGVHRNTPTQLRTIIRNWRLPARLWPQV